MSELPEGVAPASVPVPRDSASGILLVPRPDGDWGVLLGLRARRAGFLPGQLAFPGGAVEPQDRPEDPDVYGRSVAREFREETGLDIAESEWLPAGERITPPLFPRRFRTRFFVMALERPIAAPAPASPENESLCVERANEVVARWERGEIEVAPPVLGVLRCLAASGREAPAEIARRVATANAEEERAPRIEFAPDVWMLPLATATLPPATHTNAWLPGGRSFVVVDPGSALPEELDRLFAVIARRVALGSRPVAVLLTHHHRDHTEGAQETVRRLGVPLRAHERTLEGIGCDSGIPIADGELLDLEGLKLRALFTPGHAPGHLSFLVEQRDAVLSGDLVSGLSTILIDPRHGNMGDYLASLERLAKLGPRKLFPGHGPPLAGTEAGRLAEHRRMREGRIRAGLRPLPRGLEDLAREAYEEWHELPRPLTEGQTLAHLLQLEREGRARRADEGGRSWTAREGAT